MKIISKDEPVPYDGVLLTLEEYNKVLLEKSILDDMEKLANSQR